MTKQELRSAAENIVKGHTFYVEARVGSANYRNTSADKPCRALWDDARRNAAADDLIREFAKAHLADHPVDDDQPVTDEMLASRHWDKAGDWRWHSAGKIQVYWRADAVELVDQKGNIIRLPTISTWGKLRKLCAALEEACQ